MASNDPLVPADTPFNYNIGINYESWESGRTSYSIEADLDQITQNFKLIKTFHAAAVGTADPTVPIIDPTQAQVITYVVGTPDVELAMGTANSALAQGGFGTPWAPGLMTDKTYTDAWVEMLIDSFGSTANVEKHLRVVLLGNEIDANGPPPNDPSFNDYLGWIQTSFDNLSASLSDAGLGSIAVSTTIANYPLGDPSANVVASQITQYVHDNWSDAWNNAAPFVLYNQYTQNGGQSTDYAPVENYFESVETAVPDSLEVFVGETGFSSFYGAQNQATVYQQIFDWLDGMDGQQGNGGEMVPLFPFVAFDRPSFLTTPTPQEADFGIYGEDANSQPTGLKADLVGVVPSWTDTPINTVSSSNDVLHGAATQDLLASAAGHDLVFGGDGSDHLLGQAGDDLLVGWKGDDLLVGGGGDDELLGDRGNDRLLGQSGEDRMFGGDGEDLLRGGEGVDWAAGGKGDDTYVTDHRDDQLYELAGEGSDLVRAGVDFALPNDPYGGFVENLRLRIDAGDINGRGNDLDNHIRGNSGDNVLLGLGGDDWLKGQDGNDTLKGGGGADFLKGGSGEDLLILGREDVAVGGSGSDLFAFDGNEGAGNHLEIRDFQGQLSNGDAGQDHFLFAPGLKHGNFSYLGEAAFSASGNSEARFAGNGRLEIDSDGDGNTDMAAILSGFTQAGQLTAGDFVWL